MAGEFIDRDPQLPYDQRVGPPADVANDASKLIEANRTPAGEPPVGFDVRSTYDSRPVLGFDFNIVQVYAVESWDSQSVLLEFTVPRGYVGVLRRLHHSFDPVPITDSRNDVTVTLFINDAAAPYNLNIPIGSESDSIVETFLIADELQTIGARFTVSAAIQATGPDLYAHFYGNFLVKTGRSAQFEIANPTDKAFASGHALPPYSLPLPSLPIGQAQSAPYAPAAIVATPPAYDPCKISQADFARLSVADKIRWRQRCGGFGVSFKQS